MSMRISRDTAVVLAVIGVVVIPLLVVILIRGEQRLDGLTIPSGGEQGALDVIQGQVGPAARRSERARRRGIEEEEFRRRELEEEERREEEEDEQSLGTNIGLREPGLISQGNGRVPEGPSPIERVTAVLNANLEGATGQAGLTLNRDMDPALLVVSALVDGLSPDTRYTLCVGDQVIETNESDAQGNLFLQDAVIFDERTLSGRVTSIREGSGCNGPVSLQALISGVLSQTQEDPLPGFPLPINRPNIYYIYAGQPP